MPAAFDLTYVNLPFVVKYYLVGGLHIQAGPQFGVLIDESLSETLTNEYKEISRSSEILWNHRYLGMIFLLALRIDVRYNFGLTDISKPEVGNKVSKIRYLQLL